MSTVNGRLTVVCLPSPGLGISAWVMRLMSGMLFGVQPFDPMNFAAASGVLFLAGTAASLLPASRAARLNPLDTLREQ